MKLTFSTIIAKIRKVYESITSVQQLDVAEKYCQNLKYRVELFSDEPSPYHKSDLLEVIAREIYAQKELAVYRMTKENESYECSGCSKKCQAHRT